MAQQITDAAELETGDPVALEGNGMDTAGEIISVETRDDGDTYAYVETDSTVLPIKNTRSGPLTVDNGLMHVCGFGKVKAFSQ